MKEAWAKVTYPNSLINKTTFAVWVEEADYNAMPKTGQIEKRGVPRPYGKHTAWELLPQICVVSVNKSVGNKLYRTRLRKQCRYK
jgi:hypothetical protein